MGSVGLEEKLAEMLDKAGLDEDQRKKEIEAIQNDLKQPVKIIGAGQCGVGKSTLLRSIFAIEEDQIPDVITTDATRAETEEFNSFRIETEEGFKIEFTDGPGLGESISKDDKWIPQWIEEIPEHDLLYWVLDASSRDISHIQKNMKKILDETGFHSRVVVVLNKVDQIELERDELEEGQSGWDEDYNVPTPELEKQIERRTEDIIAKLSDYTGVSEDQMVACSALKRWHHDIVLDKLVESLPKKKRIKVAANRDVEDFTELMSDKALREIQDD